MSDPQAVRERWIACWADLPLHSGQHWDLLVAHDRRPPYSLSPQDRYRADPGRVHAGLRALQDQYEGLVVRLETVAGQLRLVETQGGENLSDRAATFRTLAQGARRKLDRLPARASFAEIQEAVADVTRYADRQMAVARIDLVDAAPPEASRR